MDQQFSIDDQDQEKHFIGNLLSDDEASGARSESSSRQNHKLSSLPSFEKVTSNANAIGPSPNQAFWPEPPPPYSPPLNVNWGLVTPETGDVFNTFGYGQEKSNFSGHNFSSYDQAFSTEFVDNYYSSLMKPFEGMPSHPQKSLPPPSFNQIQQLSANKLQDKRKGRFLQKNMHPSDTDLLKRTSSDDLGNPNDFPSLYRQMSEHLPSAPLTPSGMLPPGKSYRDVLSTKSHKPISGVLSAPGPTKPIQPPNATSPLGLKVIRATSPQTIISSKKSTPPQQAPMQKGLTKTGTKATGMDTGEKSAMAEKIAKQRTVVGFNPAEAPNGNKIDKSKDSTTTTVTDSFQKLDRKKKGAKHPTIPAHAVVSPTLSPSAPSKNPILAAFENANVKTSKKSSGKAVAKGEKAKEGQKKGKVQTVEEPEKKKDVEEQADSDEPYDVDTETSEEEEEDDTFYNQQNFRPKQKVRRGTDPDAKRLMASENVSATRKRKNKQSQPLPVVYLTMFLSLIWEALVKFGTWIVDLIVDVACLSYWAIVEAATTVAWKIVKVYQAVCHAISSFFKNIFLGTWNALKIGIRLTNSCCSDDYFLVGLDENIILPSCCEEVLERLYICHPIDAYSILGLKSDCSLEDIRRFYKRQIHLVRPERRLNFGVEQAHRLLTVAFDLLKEPEIRKEYDAELLNRVKLKNSELDSILSDLRWNIDNSTHILHCDCGTDHLVYRLPEMKSLRYCKKCGERHLAKNNDIWVETRIFGLVWTYYTCLNGICFDITTWANCEHNHLKHIKPNSHQAYYRLQFESLTNGKGEPKKHRCTQGFDDSPIYHANFQYYRSLVEREGGSNSNLSKTTFICCCSQSLLNTTESLENEIEDDKIPSVACCMGGSYIGVSTNASAFTPVDLDPDRAKRAGRRRRIR